jgi:iron complex transport system substrate-binding protein
MSAARGIGLRIVLAAIGSMSFCALASRIDAKGSAARPTESVRTMTVVDDTGHRVTVTYPPERIVSLAPGATEMLFAVGAGGRVVATDDVSNEPPAAQKLPKLGELANIDVERLIATKPSVVVVWPYGTSVAQIALLGRLGLPVYREEPLTLEDIAASMRRLGQLAGTTAEANRVASALQARLAALASHYGRARNAPTALLEVWDKPLYTVGGRQPMSDALRVCGTRNVFDDLQQAAPAVSVEAVIARNPDIIIAAAPPGKGTAWLASWRRFPMLRAVRSGRLVAFDDQRLSGLGPGAIDATAALCKRLAALSGLASPGA